MKKEDWIFENWGFKFLKVSFFVFISFVLFFLISKIIFFFLNSQLFRFDFYLFQVHFFVGNILYWIFYNSFHFFLLTKKTTKKKKKWNTCWLFFLLSFTLAKLTYAWLLHIKEEHSMMLTKSQPKIASFKHHHAEDVTHKNHQ